MEVIFMKLELIKHPSDWLTKKLDPWDFDNPPMDPNELKEEMLKVMKANLGIGLSANQVGINARCFVFSMSTVDNATDREQLCINPEIVKTDETEVENFEGCLSYPEVLIQVKRPYKIVGRWTDVNGKIREETMVGYDSVCFQHELDHLNGITFDQHVSPMIWKEAVETAKKKLNA